MRKAIGAVPALVDQGDADDFFQERLKPRALEAAAIESRYPLTFHRSEGYDHSYYFIASFVEEQLRFHAGHLRA